MLLSITLVLLGGLLISQIARRLGAPPLVGMIVGGLILGPEALDLITPELLTGADILRTMAVMVILMKAGLGLDAEKLIQQGSVALRLGFLPALGETIVVTIAAMVLLDFNFSSALLLGCIISPESPAVIVPGMLKLKSGGWGVAKGIPDAILTGSALSDVLILLIFSLTLNFILGGGDNLVLLPLQLILQIALGILIGWITAKLLIRMLKHQKWSQNAVQDTIIAASLGLIQVVVAELYPVFSGYLAVMSTGFFLVQLDLPLARRLRKGFDSLWIVAEIFLFVLLGANIPVSVLRSSLGVGLVILLLGIVVGRGIGWYLSTLGSNWNKKERLFLLPGNSAKATVQAAIGAIPLAQGIAGGDTILALAALAIVITAPLGAWATTTFAPQLLTKGEVDPTKVTVERSLVLLAAIDGSPVTTDVLLKAADLARRGDAEVIVLHILQDRESEQTQDLERQTHQLLRDIRHRFLKVYGNIPETILKVGQDFQVAEIILGKRGRRDRLMGSVSEAVVESSMIPVLVVEEGAR